MTQHLESKAKIFKALGHTSRLAIVEALCSTELCVCDIVPIVGKDISTVSKHLSILSEAGVLAKRKEGTSVYYRLDMDCITGFLNCLENHIAKKISAKAQELVNASIKTNI